MFCCVLMTIAGLPGQKLITKETRFQDCLDFTHLLWVQEIETVTLGSSSPSPCQHFSSCQRKDGFHTAHGGGGPCTVLFFFNLLGCAGSYLQHVGPSSLTKAGTQGPLHGEHGILATRPPGKWWSCPKVLFSIRRMTVGLRWERVAPGYG